MAFLYDHSPEEIQERIFQNVRELLEEYGDDLDNILRAELKKKNMVATGTLLNSLKTQIVNITGKRINQLQWRFESRGRAAELRSLTYNTSPPPITWYKGKPGILQWLLKNPDKAKYVPGLKEKRKPNGLKDYKRIAGAMSFGKLKKRKKRRKMWYTNKIYGRLPELVNALLDGLTEEEIRMFNNLTQELD